MAANDIAKLGKLHTLFPRQIFRSAGSPCWSKFAACLRCRSDVHRRNAAAIALQQNVTQGRCHDSL